MIYENYAKMREGMGHFRMSLNMYGELSNVEQFSLW
jgi:hypothetical protein